MLVQLAEASEIESWLQIVREVEPLFGPMPDFKEHLERGIDRGTALVARDESIVGGGLLLSRDRLHLNWLAVRPTHRGHGAGRALIVEALRMTPPGELIIVDTFGADNPGGLPARRLYESLGFVAREQLPPGPEGGSRQRFVRPSHASRTR